MGHFKRPLLNAIRQNCTECCAGAIAEVGRCRMITCPMWPYRMGANPFRAVREVSEDQLEVLRSPPGQRPDIMREFHGQSGAWRRRNGVMHHMESAAAADGTRSRRKRPRARSDADA